MSINGSWTPGISLAQPSPPPLLVSTIELPNQRVLRNSCATAALVVAEIRRSQLSRTQNG